MHTMLVFMKAAAAFPFHTGYHVTGYSEKAFYLTIVKQKEIPVSCFFIVFLHKEAP